MLHLNHAFRTAILLAVGHSLLAQPIRLTDLNPNAGHSFPPGPPSTEIQILAMGENLFFAADDGIHGTELWKSDGTVPGTTLLKDINPGSGNSDPEYLTVFSGKLYFAAKDGTAGIELWVSDGTEAGTQLHKDLRPGPSNAEPRYLTVAGDALYCAATKSFDTNALWKTDGTIAGTVEIIPPNPFNGLAPQQLTSMGDKLYFTGPDEELWSTDGTDNGTVLIKDIANSSIGPYINHMIALENKLYFEANDETGNDEPWVSDGTETGTMKLKEIGPGPDGSSPWKFFSFKGHVYFSAKNKLWRTDGTPAGTALFKNITVFQSSNDPSHFISDTNYLYFPADDDINGVELWRSDGTPGGTVMVKNISNGFFDSAPRFFAFGSDGLLYFQAYHSDLGAELWKSDGTAAGTVMVADLQPGPGHGEPQSLTIMNGVLYFIADDGIHGRELWKLDLTSGVKNPEWDKGLFSASPNPATDFIRLTFPHQLPGGPSSLRLFNCSGQVLYWMEPSAAASPEIIISTTNLPDGLYWLEMLSGHRAELKKVVIMRR